MPDEVVMFLAGALDQFARLSSPRKRGPNCAAHGGFWTMGSRFRGNDMGVRINKEKSKT